ncbi:unnamed protein product, partial [Durusdinium trenchii]
MTVLLDLRLHACWRPEPWSWPRSCLRSFVQQNFSRVSILGPIVDKTLSEGESEAGDEAETAWWSALRLAESLAVCQNAEVEATLRSLAIRTVRVAEKPELLVAALEVLAALPQHSEAEAEQKVFSLEPAVVEKLLLLLVDMEEEVDLQEIAWVMLEAADQTDLEEHLEVLNAAASRMTEEVQRKLAPSFLDFLRKCEAAGEK